MSDYSLMQEKAQILTCLFFDGTVTQAQIDEIAQKRLGLDPGGEYVMPVKPEDWVPTSSLPPPVKTVEVAGEEMVLTYKEAKPADAPKVMEQVLTPGNKESGEVFHAPPPAAAAKPAEPPPAARPAAHAAERSERR